MSGADRACCAHDRRVRASCRFRARASEDPSRARGSRDRAGRCPRGHPARAGAAVSRRSHAAHRRPSRPVGRRGLPVRHRPDQRDLHARHRVRRDRGRRAADRGRQRDLAGRRDRPRHGPQHGPAVRRQQARWAGSKSTLRRGSLQRDAAREEHAGGHRRGEVVPRRPPEPRVRGSATTTSSPTTARSSAAARRSQGNHVENENSHRIGINMPGTVGDRPTRRQARAYNWLLHHAHTDDMPRAHRNGATT